MSWNVLKLRNESEEDDRNINSSISLISFIIFYSYMSVSKLLL